MENLILLLSQLVGLMILKAQECLFGMINFNLRETWHYTNREFNPEGIIAPGNDNFNIIDALGKV